ncbi:MAG: hypothetical protein ACPK7O_10725 [Methanobacterium sp.]
MTKKSFCPRCKSNKVKYEQIYEGDGTWKCRNCGYEGSIILKDRNIEKNIRAARKMDKLSKRMF